MISLYHIALLGRIFLLGLERIAVKDLGRHRDGNTAPFMLFFVATILYIPLLYFAKIPTDLSVLKYITLCAFIYSFTFTLYVKSMSLGEISVVGPLYNFNVFFLLIISTIFLKEKFTIYKLIGISLMVYGSSFLRKKGNIFQSIGHLFKDKACQLMMIFSVFLAIGRTFDRYLVQGVDPIFYGFTLYLEMSFILLVYNLLRKRGRNSLILFKEKPVMSIIAGAINTGAYVCLLFALTKIEVSVAEPAAMLSMIISMLIAKVIYKEKIGTRLIGVIIMIVGTWLLFI
ncbi:MAG: hypothetical protein C0601_01915 [Candidatus Muiribacterium halophilum]|uniref:EamA domain-containing protein n=1 Tax=Muiribacterium halophilum TaxID=2053465 RepID=A0A2N5ZL32_MUIH1|nr:MAG: hypothetical protein C0601_01915 [Candidatus Muirbacterium halophilum]